MSTDKELSKDELIYLLKKEINEKLLLADKFNELKEKWVNMGFTHNYSANMKSWETIVDFFENDERIKEHYRPTSNALNEKECYNKAIHMIETMIKILHLIGE
jgi:hypothetical protein